MVIWGMILPCRPPQATPCPHRCPDDPAQLDGAQLVHCEACLQAAQAWGLHTGLIRLRWHWEARLQHLDNRWEIRYFDTPGGAGQWLLSQLNPDSARAEILHGFMLEGLRNAGALTPTLTPTAHLPGGGDVYGTLLEGVARLTGHAGVRDLPTGSDMRLTPALRAALQVADTSLTPC